MNSVEQLLGSAALARHGKRVALVCGDQALSYEALAAEVARASGALRLLAIPPDDLQRVPATTLVQAQDPW